MQHKAKHEVEGKNCINKFNAVEDALYVIGGRWRLPIIAVLSDGNKRFIEIQRSVKGMSAKVLSHELKELELNGFVTRFLQDEKHVIEYRSTEYSRTLKKVVHALDEWGKNHLIKVRQR